MGDITRHQRKIHPVNPENHEKWGCSLQPLGAIYFTVVDNANTNLKMYESGNSALPHWSKQLKLTVVRGRLSLPVTHLQHSFSKHTHTCLSLSLWACEPLTRRSVWLQARSILHACQKPTNPSRLASTTPFCYAPPSKLQRDMALSISSESLNHFASHLGGWFNFILIMFQYFFKRIDVFSLLDQNGLHIYLSTWPFRNSEYLLNENVNPPCAYNFSG